MAKNCLIRDVGRLQMADRAVHDWYRFVLSFPPHLVRDYLQRFQIGPEHTVLDPFCGTGTTLVECKKTGTPSIGLEAHPMSHFASRVKVRWDVAPEALEEHASDVAEAARAELAAQGIEDAPFLHVNETAGAALRTLPPELMKLLLRNSISPLPLHKTLVLTDCLNRVRNDACRDHERLALAKCAVSSASNLHFGPEVGVGKVKADAAVVSAWLMEVKRVAADLRQAQDLQHTPADVLLADAREPEKALPPESIDAVITSPPYPNEKDYTRTTRLESILLGFIASKQDLQALKRRLMRSNTRGVYTADDDDQWVSQNREIQEIAEAIEKRRKELGKTSGFERQYARVTKLYFGGMARHFAGLRKVLKPGARLAYVVGDQASYLRIMIRTGRILGDIARTLGYEVESIDLFRTRIATATCERLREEVLVLRWPG